MNSSCLSSFLFVAGLVACGSSGQEASSTSPNEPASPTGVAPSTFCSRVCVPEDRTPCEAFASRHSDAFLAAFETCGDEPACIQPKMNAAARTPRQTRFAEDYCTRCGETAPTCASRFFLDDQPGGPLASFSDARLDAVATKCVADLRSAGGPLGALQCKVSFDACILGFLGEDLRTGPICRKR